MKKTLMAALAAIAMFGASAQGSLAAFGNYSLYKEDFRKTAPGAGFRIYFEPKGKLSYSVDLVYGGTMKEQSSVSLQNSQNANDVKLVNSNLNYQFNTLNLNAHYSFLGDRDTPSKLYATLGAGCVFMNYKENIKDSYDKSQYTPLGETKGMDYGFTINTGLGGEYRIGKPAIFGDAGLAIPATNIGNEYAENRVPVHFILNLGIKYPIGRHNDN